MAGESIAVAIYKLGMENQQYIAAARQAAQAGDQLVAANMKVADSEEKAGQASKLRANFIEAQLARGDKRIQAEERYAAQVARVKQAEEENLSTAAKRQQLLDQYSSQLNKTISDLERKAKAERDAVQAEKEAEAAARNLARIESEHALALKNTIGALGGEQGALIAAANAGDRHARAMLDLARGQVAINKELQSGAIGLREHARLNDLLQQTYRGSVTAIAHQEAAMRKSSTITGLARHELINLSRQLQDIGVSLAGGQSPFRILIEQGSQIADIFASSKAAFGDTFRNLISWAGRAVGSITGIITIVTALGAAAGALALNWLEGQRAIEKALTGIGERAGVSVAQVQKMAEAASANTRLSTNAARDAAAQFIQTGKIYGDNIQTAVNLTDKFALAMGVSASDGAKQLAEILGNVDTRADALNKRFGFLDGATRELHRSLVAQNREQEALALLMEKATPSITKAADAASSYAKAWMFVTKALSDSIEMMGRAIAKGAEFEAVPRPAGRERQGSPGRVAAQELRGQLPVTAEAADRATKSVEAYERALLAAAAAAADSRFREFGLQAEAGVNALIPQIAQLNNLETVLNDVKRAQESGAVRGGMAAGMADQLQAAANAGEILRRTLTETQAATARANAETLKLVGGLNQAGVAIIKMGNEYKRMSIEVAKTLFALNQQIAIATAVTGQEKIAAQERARYNQLLLEGKKIQEAIAISTKETVLAQTQLATQHEQNMAALEDQLRIAKARTESEQLSAQYEADINSRLREGATLMQAEEEAAMKRKITEEQIAGQKAKTRAQTQQALDAENEQYRAQQQLLIQIEEIRNNIRIGIGRGEFGGFTENDLAFWQSTMFKGAKRLVEGDTGGIPSVGMVGAAGAGILYRPAFAEPITLELQALMRKGAEANLALADALRADMRTKTLEATFGTKEFIAKQEEAARMQVEAAREQKEAAEQQIEAAKAAREAMISSLDEAVADIVATKLLAGQSAQAVNMLIETGAIQFGTASTRFQTQMDLYKRAGASNAQIAADIRAGVIGEGARPSELLAALDSLTDAVQGNTDAQLGLSEFYTQQGDRRLGYRGYSVQRPGFGTPGAITGTGGTGAGTGGIGGMGGVINQPGVYGDPVYSTAPVLYVRYVNGRYEKGYYLNGQWVMIEIYNYTGAGTGSYPTQAQRTAQAVTAVRGYAGGGIVDRPQMAMIGEAGPEAFVPLQGGAIPVKLTGNNDNKPTTVVNINAPLITFMAEPTRDDVRESAFQASQQLRRLMAG